MSKTYAYLSSNTNGRFVFGNTVNIHEVFRVYKSTTSARLTDGSSVEIHQDQFSLNKPYVIPSKPGCDDACTSSSVTIGATVNFTGPLTSKSQKLALLDELVRLIKGPQVGRHLDGFPTNPTIEYVLKDVTP